MSAHITRELAMINDEDLLRKMWQDTDDFGRKKEIRSHMYKLREQRLKEFYNSEEIQRTTQTKSFNKSTHADSLADHSFLSLKSKEIRDSESPTRDVNYKVTEKLNDQGWNVVSSKEKSEDGKTITSKRSATTSGSQKIEGGKIDYAARNDQQSLIYQDGDDKNFTKSVGAASKSVIKQEAQGGDQNSSFKSSSTKTSSSSQIVTEQRGTRGDDLSQNLDGNTKVFKESKTLPDGSVVTTTRYETKGGTTSSSSNKQFSSHQESSYSTGITTDQKQQAIEYQVDVTDDVSSKKHDYIDRKKISEYQTSKATEQHDVPESTTYITKRTKTITEDQPREEIISTTCTTNKVQQKEQVVQSDRKSPEKRHPIKPPKSEMDQKLAPTEGQYDTTYRNDYTQKKISVEVSATHDAFARSLRAVSPDRFSKCSSPSRGSTRSLRTSTTSLRSSASPEKLRRYSPERSPSPKKSSFSTTYSTNTITSRNKIDSSTLSRRKKPKSRSPSPSSTFEYIRSQHDIVTDLDATDDLVIRPATLEITTKKTKKVTERSPTSPLSELVINRKSPTKEVPRKSSLRSSSKELSPSEQPPKYFTVTPDKERPVLKRTDTYEDRCKLILGLTSETTNERRRSSLDKVGSTIKRDSITNGYSKDVERKEVQTTKSQNRKSPQKVVDNNKYPVRKSPSKVGPGISEFPSQIRKTPERIPLEKYPEKKSPVKSGPSISEFPSQIRKTPERLPFEKYPEKKSPVKSGPTISEFPSQIRKSTPPAEKEPLPKYPEKTTSAKVAPTINEFPSQIRKSIEKEPLENYPEKKSPIHIAPSAISEFPSQIRKSPERQPLEKYPERKSPTKTAPTISEFPSQRKFSNEPQKPKELDSDDSSDEEINEITLQSTKEKVPVREPLATKKFISQLCRGEEIESTDITKNKKVSLDEEIIKDEVKQSRTVKKDKPRYKVTNNTFINNEKENLETIEIKVKVPTKNKVTQKTTSTTTTTKCSKVVDKPKQKEPTKKTSEKITLYNVENLSDAEEDNTIHIRTHRIDTTRKPLDKPKSKQPTTTSVPKAKKPEAKPVCTRQTIDLKQRASTTIKKTGSSSSLPTKKHTVTATINVSPKLQPITKTFTTKTVPNRTSSKPIIQPKAKSPFKPKLQNGQQNDSDTEIDSLEGSTIDITKNSSTTTTTTKSINRTTSDQIFKSPIQKKPTPIRGLSKPELTSSKPTEGVEPKSRPRKLEKKCISTKSIIINNKDAEREIIVDLQRSKSSREPTPDRVCACPISSEDDSAIPRLPDQIVEPDEVRRYRKPKISDIPLTEGEDINEFTRITDITEAVQKITDVDKVEETDDSLLSVNKKINKFLHTADKLTKQDGPAPKVERPHLLVTEELESDECLLSVSDKVSKFITTAEELIAPQDRPKSPKFMNYPEGDVSEKVTHFTSAAEEISRPKGVAPKVERPNLSGQVDETIRNDECLLSVSDKVSKFISTAEKLTTHDKSTPVISLAKLDKVSTDCVQIETDEQTYTRRSKSPEKRTSSSPRMETITTTRSTKSPSPERVTPTRRPSNQYSSINTQEVKLGRRESSPKLPNATPKSTKQEEPKVLNSSRLRSTESVKKAKAIFENINQEQSILKQRDILSRPSVFEGRKLAARTKLTYPDEEIAVPKPKLASSRSKSPEKVPEKSKSPERAAPSARPRSKSPEKLPQRSKSPEKVVPRSKSPENKAPPKIVSNDAREPTPDGEVPGYMRPLDRSLRANSPHRTEVQDETKVPTKFGVSLRRTDSGRAITTNIITERRRSSTTAEKRITEEEIEEIFELSVLDDLLEKVVGYELRRKIRTQIRLVKKLISENRLTSYVTKRSQNETEYQSKYKIRQPSPEKKIVSDTSIKTTAEYQSSYTTSTRRTSTTTKSRSTSPEKRASPERRTTTSSTTLKKVVPAKISSTDGTSQPEWVKQRNLRKTTDQVHKVSNYRKETSSTASRKSPAKEMKPTDLITSSYGVGPTDENGAPLFGLRALRAQNKMTDTTKVQGTVIKSQYYSKNGEEPVGQISVTKYSSDPRDIEQNYDSTTNNGLTSVTTTQKFGYKDTPTLKSFGRKKKVNEDEDETSTSTTTTTTTKVSRRGSVKALSQKFIDNAVETLKSETKQTSYPKAGLILRTSSFKGSGSGTDDSRETSPVTTRELETNTITSSSTSRGETFLTNKSKITGVQDVLTRMKNQDVVQGDTEEDIEARGLLNKFLGSQVILSGVESCSSSKAMFAPTVSTKRSTKITSTVTKNGKPSIETRIFERPVTEEDLETVWDEQTLRLLLEQSDDYEERRIIRARLRQVMAEQEACAELVKEASHQTEQSSGAGEAIEEKVHTTKQTIRQGPLTTTQVTTKVTTQVQAKKPISPFAKFRQLDKQNSLNTPPSTPKTPSGSGPLFKFTDPALSQSASTIKDRLLYWCRMKTKEYENIQLDNFSTSWADGLAFCALIHHFLPDSFDYHSLTPKERRHNFTLAFQIADEKADIAPLLDVDDMVATRRPDWKCVFTYVQSIYRRFKDED